MPLPWSIIGLAIGSAVVFGVEHWPGRGGTNETLISGAARWLIVLAPTLMLGWLATQEPDPWRLATLAFFAGALLLVAALDAAYRLVPNLLVLPLTLLAVLIGPAPTPGLAIAGALVGLGFFLMLYWLGMRLYGTAVLGMGDVKLAMLLGGVAGWPHVWYVLLLGMLLAGLAALLLITVRGANRRSTMPYGSCLASAGLIVMSLAAHA